MFSNTERLEYSTGRMEEERIIKLTNKGHAIVVGDIHGNFENLKIIERLFHETNYILLFLGDYIDRGPKQLEVLKSIIEMKTEYSDQVFLLKGNHESNILKPCPHDFDFLVSEKEKSLYELFFEKLPVVAFNNNLVFLHGGIPEIRGKYKIGMLKEKRLEMEIVWNDFNPSLREMFAPNYERDPLGRIKYFSHVAVQKFLKDLGKLGIVRGHQYSLGVANKCIKHVCTLFTAGGKGGYEWYEGIEPCIAIVNLSRGNVCIERLPNERY